MPMQYIYCIAYYIVDPSWISIYVQTKLPRWAKELLHTVALLLNKHVFLGSTMLKRAYIESLQIKGAKTHSRSFRTENRPACTRVLVKSLLMK